MRLVLRPGEAEPPPEPLHTDDRRAVLVGTVVWLVLLVVVLAAPSVRPGGDGRAVGACVAGVLLGLLALGYLSRRDRRERPGERG
ncbi:DUF2530 domain-containing protein [Kineococcus glutinatus]|uniref:DUF2530 domain-containing protein n=1 Tax=Kineococcus glutinatus TaxID=1070872 RepID=A0ABP9I9L5_9ACTN